ncbi:unnamed protein product [Caenorhabditis sp. 36 PRJEB53466]|nr:unnamed protein product [Caenorhabditis sp. 36 PRJEB53466]
MNSCRVTTRSILEDGARKAVVQSIAPNTEPGNLLESVDFEEMSNFEESFPFEDENKERDTEESGNIEEPANSRNSDDEDERARDWKEISENDLLRCLFLLSTTQSAAAVDRNFQCDEVKNEQKLKNLILSKNGVLRVKCCSECAQDLSKYVL